ncbi:MAG: VTT domain-containing protein [Anaerolineales bacterium]|nr:VTT domain-containing protein [Anaerolineales bacterium]
MSKERRLIIARIIALLVVIGLSVYVFTLSDAEIKKIEGLGYFGIALLAFLSNATVLIPAPGLFVVFAMGARFNPLFVGLAGGLGGALGEISGYLAGFSGQAIIEDYKIYQRSVGWMKKHGGITILGLSIIPNPVFDITGIAAGALKMPLWKFLIWVWIGVTTKMTYIAYAGAGAFSLPWLTQLFNE